MRSAIPARRWSARSTPRPSRISGNTVSHQTAQRQAGLRHRILRGDLGRRVHRHHAGRPAVRRHRQAGRLVVHHPRGRAHRRHVVTVDDDGDADFRTVQGALNYACRTFAKTDPVTINVKNGAYDELLYLRGKDNVSIKGESRDGVVIRYTNNDTLNSGTGSSQPASARLAGGRARGDAGRNVRHAGARHAEHQEHDDPLGLASRARPKRCTSTATRA
jgi:pectate lyase